MSWAALNRELRGLLPRFSLPADDPAAYDLEERLVDLVADGGELSRLRARGVEPSPAEDEALRK